MSVNNLTELNDCDNVTGFTDTNKSPGLNTDAGQRYEGSGAISVQHTNTAGGNAMDTTQTSGGGGTFSVDMSDRTYYFQLKDNLVDTFTEALALFPDLRASQIADLLASNQGLTGSQFALIDPRGDINISSEGVDQPQVRNVSIGCSTGLTPQQISALISGLYVKTLATSRLTASKR